MLGGPFPDDGRSFPIESSGNVRPLYVSFSAHQNEATEYGGDLGDVEILIVRLASNAA